jgi:hypothetical protein
MVLLTYSNRDGRGKADDGETAQMNLGDGAGVPGGAPALRMAPAAAATTGGPPTNRNSAWDVAEKQGDGGGSALFLQWGKTRQGVAEAAIYRRKSPSGVIGTSRVRSPTESKILSRSNVDS